MNKFLLTPSLYCANTLDLKNEIKELIAAGINWIHIDVMDGDFVNNYAFCPKVIDEIKQEFPNLIIDTHTMVKNLFDNIKLFKNSDYLTFHLNSLNNETEVVKLIKEIKKFNLKIGIVLDLENEFHELDKYWDLIDLVTIMSIKPGFTGQEFNQLTWKKLTEIKKIKTIHPHILFQIDGGVRWNNINQLIQHQLDLIVVGSLLFNNENYSNIVKQIYRKEFEN